MIASISTVGAVLALLASASLPAQATPTLLVDAFPGPRGSQLGPFVIESSGPLSVFRTNLATLGNELWATAGTPATTVFAGEFVLGTGGVNHVVAMHDTRFLVSADNGLWILGPSGRQLLNASLDMPRAENASAALGARVVFAGRTTQFGVEPWVTDGTFAGTVQLADLVPFGSSDPRSFTRVGERVYFLSAAGLHQTDGTVAGTVRFPHFPPGVLELVGANGLLYATIFDAVQRTFELWVSDGTAAGTRMVVDLGTRFDLFRAYPAPLGHGVVFTRHTAASGAEPWFSDGTAAGTRLIADLVPGPGSSDPRLFTAAGDHAFFITLEPRNLWSTDGGAPRQIVGTSGAIGEIRTTADGRALFALAAFRDAPINNWVVYESNGDPRQTRAIVRGFAPHLHRGKVYVQWDDTRLGVEPYVHPIGAVAQRVGYGCGVGLRASELRSTTPPRLGSLLNLRGSLAPINSVGVVAIGLPTDAPLALDGTCLVHVDLASAGAIGAFLTLQPDWSFLIRIPNDTQLVGTQVATQAWYLSPTRPLGLEVSNGLHLTLGL